MEIERTIAVDVPAAKLWAAVADPHSWPEWTDSMEQVELHGPLAPGTTATVKQPKFRAAKWTIDEVDEGTAFVWSSSAGGVKSVGGHYVKPVDDSHSELRLTFTQTGLLAGPMGVLFGKTFARYVDMELNGLKRSAESA
ncbi:MAG TPA: SRPBCC family protein [Acidimicrobiales bacterium]|jgi:uncharacterized membrane protein|nr:SRPBCC family protein [Acidimicrobiales bacterium]